MPSKFFISSEHFLSLNSDLFLFLKLLLSRYPTHAYHHIFSCRLMAEVRFSDSRIYVEILRFHLSPVISVFRKIVQLIPTQVHPLNICLTSFCTKRSFINIEQFSYDQLFSFNSKNYLSSFIKKCRLSSIDR